MPNPITVVARMMQPNAMATPGMKTSTLRRYRSMIRDSSGEAAPLLEFASVSSVESAATKSILAAIFPYSAAASLTDCLLNSTSVPSSSSAALQASAVMIRSVVSLDLLRLAEIAATTFTIGEAKQHKPHARIFLESETLLHSFYEWCTRHARSKHQSRRDGTADNTDISHQPATILFLSHVRVDARLRCPDPSEQFLPWINVVRCHCRHRSLILAGTCVASYRHLVESSHHGVNWLFNCSPEIYPCGLNSSLLNNYP